MGKGDRERKKRLRVRNERETNLPDIDEMYFCVTASGKRLFIRELEDIQKFRRKGFISVRWRRPVRGHVANTDGCVIMDGSRRYGHGYAIRCREGRLLKAGLGYGVGQDVEVTDGALVALAELLGIEFLLTDINPQAYPILTVNCDNLEVVKALNSGKHGRADLQAVVTRILAIKAQKYPVSNSLVFDSVSREGNFLADWFAELGLRRQESRHYELGDAMFEQIKNDKTVRYFVERDVNGKPYIRDEDRKKYNNYKKGNDEGDDNYGDKGKAGKGDVRGANKRIAKKEDNNDVENGRADKGDGSGKKRKADKVNNDGEKGGSIANNAKKEKHRKVG